MQLSEVLARVRDPYVAQFEMALRSQPGDEILVEPAPRDQTGSPVRTGVLALPCRVDVLLKFADGLSPLRLVTPTGVAFEPIDVPDWDGLSALIEPFEWFSCVVRVVHPSSQPDWSPLCAWFEHAFAGDDHWVRPGVARPTGRVHYLGDPTPRSSAHTWELSVDFGTAPVETFFDFCGSLTEAGFSDVWIGGNA